MKKVIWVAVLLTAAMLTGCGPVSQTNTGQATNTSTTVNNATHPTNRAQQVALKQQSVSMTILPGGRLGPDGKLHDTYTTPNFTVVQGVPVTLTVYNYDSGQHTVTNRALGLNLQATPSKRTGVPSMTTVTFTPAKVGEYMWQCMDPCDGQNSDWSMTHVGYMEGIVHVVPYQDKQYIYTTIKDGLQYAAADSQLHDSYSPASFTVEQGIPVQVMVENFDTGKHSMTAPGLNLNQVIAGATKPGDPSLTTFTFTPTKTGEFQWNCVIPCDGNGWAMSHTGYMQGDITVIS